MPKTDTTYARHSFRQLTQTPGETTRQFATRLRRAGKDCGYGEDTENQIRDEILCKCTNTYLKRKLLEEGSGLTLAKTLQIAENCEKVDSQLAAMSLEEKGENSESVNRITGSKNDGKKQKQARELRKNRGWSCYWCGRTGHFGKDPDCPARGNFCHTSGLEGHFQTQCRTRQKGDKKQRKAGKFRNHRKPRKNTANAIHSEEEDEGPEYAFAVGIETQEKIEATVGGCRLNMVIDSGASTNIVDKQTWEWLKRNKLKCESTLADKKLYTYASQAPLDVIGTFRCETSVGNTTVGAEFCVINGKGESLLGRDTAVSLGVLKMGVDVAALSTGLKIIGELLQKKYPQVFNGVGKLKDRTVQLHIDTDVRPIAQPIRKTPFSLRSKVENKIKELVDLDIIKPVEGPTPWVNPVVVVPKSGGGGGG